MGTQCSSDSYRGQKSIIIMKLILLLTVFVAMAAASPYYGLHGYYGHPYGLGLGLGVAGHPSGVSYSHRSPQGLGKRSADAEEEKAWAIHPKGGKSFVGNTVWGAGK